jgi:hypothetical protein
MIYTKIPVYNTVHKKWSYREFEKKEYIDFLKSKFKSPGTAKLEDTHYWREKSTIWETTGGDKDGQYLKDLKNTKGWNTFWLQEGIKCTKGVIYTNDAGPTKDEDLYEFYITGPYYFHLNYAPIILKHDQNKYTFPEVWDTDYFIFMYFELCQVIGYYSGVNKCRQKGWSYKIASCMMSSLFFKEKQSIKVWTASNENMSSIWKILKTNRTFLENNTGWIRHFAKDDQKEMNWHMMWKVNDSGRQTEIGRDNRLRGILTSKTSSSLAGGYNTLMVAEEAGLNKNLLEQIQFVEPSIKAGDYLTGQLLVGGSVGDLADCEDLRKITYEPEAYGFLGVPDITNASLLRLPFIATQWNYIEALRDKTDPKIVIGYNKYYDKDGNSDIEGALIAINKIRESKKMQDANTYNFYCSQNPISLDEMYQLREENMFPIPKLNKQLLWLNENYRPETYEIKENENGKLEAYPVNKPLVTDFPLTNNSYREGCVVIYEKPVSDKPFIYYAGIDPVQNLVGQGSSLMSCHIYQSLYQEGNELKGGKIVAWYTGRCYDDEDTFEIVRNLCKYYSAHCAIESDDGAFIEWMKGKKEHAMMFKRSQFPFLRDVVPNSKIGDEYGIRMGTGGGKESKVKLFLFSSMTEYINEIMGERTLPDGSKFKDYGVERIKDSMLIKELSMYGKGNFDRLISAGIAIATGRAYETAQVMQKIKIKSEEVTEKPKTIPNTFLSKYKPSMLTSKHSYFKNRL